MQPYSYCQKCSVKVIDKIAFTGDLCLYFEQISGSQQNWNRDYDPSIGRYIQSDPIGLMGGVNTYGYVGQNPVMQIDPLGLIFETGCTIMDQALGKCKEFPNDTDGFGKWADNKWDKVKDKICGGEKCETLRKRCDTWMVSQTMSTGGLDVCQTLETKCEAAKEKCKDCIPGGGGDK